MEGTGIVVDPQTGVVSLVGLSPADTEIDLVQVPATGPVVCGGLGICDPIVVVVPITLF